MWGLVFAVDHVTPQWMSWTAVVVMLVTPSANMLTSWFAASEMFPFRDDQSGLASSLGTVFYEWQLWRPPTTTEHNSYSAGLLSPALSQSLCVWKFTTTVAVMIFSRTLWQLDRKQSCLSGNRNCVVPVQRVCWALEAWAPDTKHKQAPENTGSQDKEQWGHQLWAAALIPLSFLSPSFLYSMFPWGLVESFSALFVFFLLQKSMMCECQNLHIHSLRERHLGCFYILATMGRRAATKFICRFLCKYRFLLGV